jgi:hypothetical protein
LKSCLPSDTSPLPPVPSPPLSPSPTLPPPPPLSTEEIFRDNIETLREGDHLGTSYNPEGLYKQCYTYNHTNNQREACLGVLDSVYDVELHNARIKLFGEEYGSLGVGQPSTRIA